jgi:hypothetical protein
MENPEAQAAASTHYVLLSSTVQRKKMLRYLLAANALKFFMKTTYDWERQVRSSALTGNPNTLVQIYEVPADREQAQSALNAFKQHEINIIIKQGGDLPNKKDGPLLLADPSAVGPVLLSAMGYMDSEQRRLEKEKREEPYLLHVTCSIRRGEFEDFVEYMTELVWVFNDAGLNHRVHHVWRFGDPESLVLLMLRLADNETYGKLDATCKQDQHLGRDISLHLRRYWVLRGEVPGSSFPATSLSPIPSANI